MKNLPQTLLILAIPFNKTYGHTCFNGSKKAQAGLKCPGWIASALLLTREIIVNINLLYLYGFTYSKRKGRAISAVSLRR